ncbi:MAG: ATP synthase F1 subunit delta [Deltaproteobacteria bacterium]|jgi:F-type H+-transporting ATPase subunit delta|nr:ATP synthase F1 subunit delta [Deltaproteobacteria bacterium]
MAKGISKLANRYAKALFKVDQGMNNITAIAQELAQFVELWQTAPELSLCILNPAYPKEQRKNALAGIVELMGLSGIARQFIEMVFENNRIVELPEITQALLDLVEKQAEIVRVRIETAREVGALEKAEYESRVQVSILGRLVFEWVVDYELLGGMVIKYDGKVFDGSIRGKLEKLGESIG